MQLLVALLGPFRAATGKGSSQIGETADQVRQSEAVAKAGVQLERAASFIAAKQPPFRWAGVVLAAILLLTSRTSAAIVWTVVLLAGYEIALIGLVRWSASKTKGAAALSQGADADSPAEIPTEV